MPFDTDQFDEHADPMHVGVHLLCPGIARTPHRNEL